MCGLIWRRQISVGGSEEGPSIQSGCVACATGGFWSSYGHMCASYGEACHVDVCSYWLLMLLVWICLQYSDALFGSCCTTPNCEHMIKCPSPFRSLGQDAETSARPSPTASIAGPLATVADAGWLNRTFDWKRGLTGLEAKPSGTSAKFPIAGRIGESMVSVPRVVPSFPGTCLASTRAHRMSTVASHMPGSCMSVCAIIVLHVKTSSRIVTELRNAHARAPHSCSSLVTPYGTYGFLICMHNTTLNRIQAPFAPFVGPATSNFQVAFRGQRLREPCHDGCLQLYPGRNKQPCHGVGRSNRMRSSLFSGPLALRETVLFSSSSFDVSPGSFAASDLTRSFSQVQ